MAASGAQQIQLYYSTSSGTAPVAGNLANGELAINITDGKLYYKDNSGTVQTLATQSSASGSFSDITVSGSATLSGGTANGVLYLNGSKVATSGSALTFDGTNLGIGTSSPTQRLHIQLPTGLTDGISLRSRTDGGGEFNLICADTSSATPLWKFQTGTSEDLAFLSGTSERMRLTSTGLGIGTSSPAAKLDVAGSAVLGSASTDTVRVNGYMAVGGSTSSTISIYARNTALTGVTQYGVYSGITASSSATTAVNAFTSDLRTEAASFTVSNLRGLLVADATKGAGSTITNQHGVYIADLTQGTNNYGITSLVSSGTNKWNIYASGTAQNYFGGNVLIGTTTARVFDSSSSTVTPALQNEGIDANGSSASLMRNTASNGGPVLFLGKSRSAALGGVTIVQSGDQMGQIIFEGTDGTGLIEGASIRAEVDGTPGTNDMPGRLVFATTADGASSPTERMRLDSSGNLGLGVTPSTSWASDPSATKAFQLSGGSIWSYSTSQFNLLQNAVWNGSNLLYANTAAASAYRQISGAHSWYTAASGTAGTSITFTQAMTLDASGNLLVGGTSAPLSASGRGNITINGSSTAIMNLTIGGTNKGYIFHDDSAMEVWNADNSDMKFATNNTERARIDSSGNLLVGTTSNPAGARTRIYAVAQWGMDNEINAASGSHIVFKNTNGIIGSISSSGSTTSYNTSSDYRLKENIAPMTGALAKLAALKPVTYTWKADGSDGEGFIAHELAEVVPACVTGEKDAVDADGNPVYQGIDTSFLVATLTAALQEAHGLIKDLQARVDALEAK